MTGKRIGRGPARGQGSREPGPAKAPPPAWRGAGTWLALGAIVLLLAATVYFVLAPLQAPSPEAGAPAVATAVAAPAYVGAAACAACHAREHAAWQGSHHDRAMAVATEESVLGDFANATFRRAGTSARFFRRDGKFFVNTDGPDGRPADFEIRYTFGVSPLQQYLVELPGGRLQALGIAWDARSAAQGGQRWFDLYPDRRLRAGDPLHWTGIDQVWNYQCADCHSTNLRKNYDADAGRYATTWTDINVACEACHGPGADHVAWARRDGDWRRRAGAGKGLTVALDERRGASWTIDPQTGNAVRSPARATAREIEVCARCHARRSQFNDDWHAGSRLADGFRAALAGPGLYEDDGQMREEVYTYGSFAMSRMQAKGVTCSDCHDPHSQRLRAPGNAVCAQCHAPARYDAAAHHRHPPGSPGAACAACHMPTTTYMIVDPRHDHGFRIPRPDRTASLGVPNACNQCHRDRTAQWAAAAVRSWYPQPKPRFQTFAEAFADAARGAPGAQRALAAVAADREQPAFVRASAVQRLAPYLGPATLPAVRAALDDPDALVRAAAVAVLAGADPATRAGLLPRALADPVREVRMGAARALAGEPAERLSLRDRAHFERALGEYVAAERFNADRPEGRVNLGNLHAVEGRYEEALAAYRAALLLDPTFVQAAINLADLYRSRGLESEAEKTLRGALARDPRAAPVLHALGLSLIRQQRPAEALAALAQAARLDPGNARFAYVYAVALNDAGRGAQARHELAGVLKRRPYDRDALLALALFERDAGNRGAALRHARQLAELEPDDPQAQQLVRQLAAAGR